MELSEEAIEYAKLLEKIKKTLPNAFRHIMGLIKVFTQNKK